MKLSAPEMAALCEYVDVRRAAGAGYDVIAGELEPYTVPTSDDDEGGPRLTAEELEGLEEWHRKWSQRQAYLSRQRRCGDVRGGSGGIAEVEVDWADVESGKVKLAVEEQGASDPVFERAEALRVVMYLKRGLLKARWRWVCHRTIMLRPGMEWEMRVGPGKLTLPDGEEEWLWGAVILRVGADVRVFPECRKRRERPPGWNGFRFRSLEIERRELVGEKIDMRDISARLLTLLYTCLGPEKSGIRNNEHLAQLLGVTREAMRVRKKRIMEDAGMRSAAGLVPARANGGRATQDRLRRNDETRSPKSEQPNSITPCRQN